MKYPKILSFLALLFGEETTFFLAILAGKGEIPIFYVILFGFIIARDANNRPIYSVSRI